MTRTGSSVHHSLWLERLPDAGFDTTGQFHFRQKGSCLPSTTFAKNCAHSTSLTPSTEVEDSTEQTRLGTKKSGQTVGESLVPF